MDLGVRPMYFTSPSGSWRSGDGVPGQFPAGLRVLVVDDDPTCLRILEKMLKNCLYEVTTCNRAEIALDLLRDNRNGYDIVISDVHMPDMDGFKLLEHVGLEMDLPVIMMSADDSKNVVMKGVTHGACDYLIKPVRMEALKNIWQHLVRRKKYEWKEKDFEQSPSADEQKLPDDVDYSSSANNEGNWTNSKKRKDEEDEGEERDDTSTLKKPRVVWSVELHQQFVTAVNQLGIDKAVPKKILELMNVPGLTRENVASHLQKYRLYLRRLSGVSHHQNGFPNPFIGPPDSPFGPMSSLDLQAVAASGQLPPQSLATIQAATLGQRNIFSFENPKLRFVSGSQQQNNNKKVSLLHGIPTNMDSKQLATLHQSAQPFAHVSMQVGQRATQNNSIPSPMVQVQPQPRMQIVNEISSSVSQSQPVAIPSQPVLGRTGIDNVTGVDFSSQSMDFSGSCFSLARNAGMLSLASKPQEVNGPQGLVPNYDVFNYLNQNRNRDWHLQDVGSCVQGGLNVSPPVLIHQPFSNNQKSGRNTASIGQQINSTLADNPLRIKDERVPSMGFQNGLLHEQFGQEDLMSALLKEQQEGVGPIDNEFSFDAYHLDNLPV